MVTKKKDTRKRMQKFRTPPGTKPYDGTQQTWYLYPGNDHTNAIVCREMETEIVEKNVRTNIGIVPDMIRVSWSLIRHLRASNDPDLEFLYFRQLGEEEIRYWGSHNLDWEELSFAELTESALKGIR